MFTIAVHSTRTPVLVVVGGDLDAQTACALRRRLQTLPARDTVVDLSALGFCGAAGIEVLRDHGARLGGNGVALELTGTSPALRGILHRLGLDETLPCAHAAEALVGPAMPSH
ncbi:STAS domain-containing protein [Tomitella gaofuii]|uniref:STAS domain-containing protein n=1 Tax=Tomitella gaofuii TaxID=2760083 RepID=UPI0015F973FF|nr:STAS domain-containing protein [Tomitella gaofuii]